MLQWMGGLRRKVATSRKSTHKRQRQYFEQRKRQQQACGLENYADGRNKRHQYHEESRSLDIISFMNLATIANEHNSGCISNAEESSDASHVQVNYHGMMGSPTCLSKSATPKSFEDLYEAKAASACFKEKSTSVMNVSTSIGTDTTLATHNCSSQVKIDNVNGWKAPSENKLSFFDLLGDDGFCGCSEGKPELEAHVAFSVEGLGKMGLETPAHSPLQPGRAFFNDCSSFPKAARRSDSAMNYRCMEDNFDAKLNHIVHDIDISLHSSQLEVPFNSRGRLNELGNSKGRKLFSKGCKPFDVDECPVDGYISEDEKFCNSMEEKHERTSAGRLDFLDEDFLDERTHGVAWKTRPFQMSSDSADLLRAEKHEIYDYNLEDPCLLKSRGVEEVWNQFNTPVCFADPWNVESPMPYFNNLTSEKDCNFLGLDGKRCPAVGRTGGSSDATNRHAWCNLVTEDARNSMSLSEESCSFTAVRGKEAKSSASSFLKLNLSKKDHSSECWKCSKDYVNDLFREEARNGNLYEVHQGKNLKGAGYTKSFPNSYSSKTNNFLNEVSPGLRTPQPQDSLMFEDEYASADMDSAQSIPFRRTSIGIDTTLPIPESYTSREELSDKRSEFDIPDHATHFRFFSEKDVVQPPVCPVRSCGSHIFSSGRSRMVKPDSQLPSETEGQSPYSSSGASLGKIFVVPDLSRQHSISYDDENELGFHSTESRVLKELQKEVSIDNNDLSGNGTAVDVADYKDSCSEQEEVKDGTPELVESLKMRDTSECAQKTPSDIEETPSKLESCNSGKGQADIFTSSAIDAGALVQFQSGNREANLLQDTNTKENTGPKKIPIGNEGYLGIDWSYQVMLESCVLQLLCVQKVLKEERKYDSAKKL